jgi:C-terminal processing protease CtpA/Prc
MTLASIVLAGGMATAFAATWRLSEVRGCHARNATAVGYTYSGIGVELEEREDEYVVRRVFPGTPADGQVFPGARLLSADGESPDSMAGWTSLIRGEAGTPVDIEVAYGCGGQQTVTLVRDIVHIRD